MEPIEYEPYDPNTPRLSYSQVATLVMKLPDQALAVLMRGPIEIKGTCNVCHCLEDLADEGNEEAKLLMSWHDDLGVSERFNEIVKAKVIGPNWDYVANEIEAILGSIMYARCCTIYALARVEFNDRGRPGYPEEG